MYGFAATFEGQVSRPLCRRQWRTEGGDRDGQPGVGVWPIRIGQDAGLKDNPKSL